MPEETIDGIRLHYEVEGAGGDPLVLVHGYTGDVSDWRHQQGEFARTHRVLALDLRGHGLSEAPRDRSVYTVERMSHDVEALVERVGLGRYHLVGHSMGGAIVQEIALRRPGRLLSLTLHDTSFKFGEGANPAMEEWRRRRHELAETKGMAAVADFAPPTPPPPHMPPERLEESRLRLAKMSPDAFLGAWRGLVDWPGTADRLGRIAPPTLVIYGDLDFPALVMASQHMADQIPGARVEAIPEAAHSPQFERPDLFNRALRSHLEAHARSS